MAAGFDIPTTTLSDPEDDDEEEVEVRKALLRTRFVDLATSESLPPPPLPIRWRGKLLPDAAAAAAVEAAVVAAAAATARWWW